MKSGITIQSQALSFVFPAALVCLMWAGAAQLEARQAQPPAPAPSAPAAPAPQPPAGPPGGRQPIAKPATPATQTAKPPAGTTQELPLPAGYVIGPDDVLGVVFWRDKDMTVDVTVRPDGMISLPLLNEVQANGLTPEQLRENIAKDATKFYEEVPPVSIVVKTINSRKVFIMGGIAKPGPYNLSAPTTVAQLIAMAGGVVEFADVSNILIVRNEKGKDVSIKFNYKDFRKGKDLAKNIQLRPNDTVVIP